MIVDNNILKSYNPSDVTDGILMITEDVIGIADFCGENCYGLKVITIPNTVKHIGKMAFANCEDLELVLILGPDKCDIDESAFSNCPKITVECESDKR